MIADLNPLLRGWAGYFGFSQGRELASLDGWTRRRQRCVVWVQWETRGNRYRELRRLKVSVDGVNRAGFAGGSGRPGAPGLSEPPDLLKLTRTSDHCRDAALALTHKFITLFCSIAAPMLAPIKPPQVR
jgi:hypothetical protein